MKYLELKREARRIFNGNRDQYSLTGFILLDKDGEAVIQGRQPCSARLNLRSLYDGEVKTPGFLLYSIDGSTIKFHKCWAKKYYDWLFKESIWAECFVTKTYETALKHGVEVNIDAPYNVMYQATIALRIWEYPSVFRSQIALMRKGLEGHLSMVLSMLFRVDVETGKIGQHFFSGGGHYCLEASTFLRGEKAFERFTKKEIATRQSAYRVFFETKCASRIQTNFLLWERGEVENSFRVESRVINLKCRSFLSGGQQKKNVNNPFEIFQKDFGRNPSISLDTFVKRVNNSKGIYKELINA